MSKADTLPCLRLDEEQDRPIFSAEDCQRLCWLAVCLGIFALTVAGTSWLLWHFDAPLRQAWAALMHWAECAFWAWASLNC